MNFPRSARLQEGCGTGSSPADRALEVEGCKQAGHLKVKGGPADRGVTIFILKKDPKKATLDTWLKYRFPYHISAYAINR